MAHGFDYTVALKNSATGIRYSLLLPRRPDLVACGYGHGTISQYRNLATRCDGCSTLRRSRFDGNYPITISRDRCLYRASPFWRDDPP